MKNVKEVNPTFKFWIENKVANERTFFVSDIRLVFQKWLLKQDMAWLHYHSSLNVILFFISDKSGLNATHDNKDTSEIAKLLKPDYINMISGINPVTKLPQRLNG